jgi:hypothetical protein
MFKLFPLCKKNHFVSTIIFIFSVAVLTVHGQNARPALTNADIIEMTKEKVPETQIVKAIQTSETDFDISPKGLIQLKKGKVKARVVDMMQSIQTNKNNSRNSASKTSEQPKNQPSEKETAVNSTPKPKPIATKDAEFFTIDLQKCLLSGTTVNCYFSVTNNGADRKLFMRSRSELVDLAGKTARFYNYVMGSASGNINGSVQPANMLTSAKIDNAVVSFTDVDPNLETIGRLTLVFDIHNTTDFSVQFRNIPIEKSVKK